MKKNNFLKFFIPAMLLGLGSAQAALTGLVVDEQNVPVANVNLAIFNGPNIKGSAVSGVDGRFSLTNGVLVPIKQELGFKVQVLADQLSL